MVRQQGQISCIYLETIKYFHAIFFLASHLSLLREEKESCGHSGGIEGKPYMLPVYLSKEL